MCHSASACGRRSDYVFAWIFDYNSFRGKNATNELSIINGWMETLFNAWIFSGCHLKSKSQKSHFCFIVRHHLRQYTRALIGAQVSSHRAFNEFFAIKFMKWHQQWESARAKETNASFGSETWNNNGTAERRPKEILVQVEDDMSTMRRIIRIWAHSIRQMRRKHFCCKCDANKRDSDTKKKERAPAWTNERTNEEILKVKQATKTCHICLRDFELRIFFTNIIPPSKAKQCQRKKRPSHLFNNLLSLHDLYTLMPFTPQIPNCALQFVSGWVKNNVLESVGSFIIYMVLFSLPLAT